MSCADNRMKQHSSEHEGGVSRENLGLEGWENVSYCFCTFTIAHFQVLRGNKSLADLTSDFHAERLSLQMDQGQTRSKNRTLPHNLEQAVQEANPPPQQLV